MAGPIHYLSLFSGIEAASVAWEPLGFTPDAFAEIEPFPSAVLKHRWPDVPNLGDVTKVDWEEWAGRVDVLVGGSPCFVAGTSVLTQRGFVPIETVRVGDMVLTHRNRWRRVTATGSKLADTIILKGQGSAGIECTPNHPFWCMRKDTTIPEWVEARHMAGNMWLKLDGASDGHWLPVAGIMPGHENVRVWNLTVEEDNSYTADGIAVHNCQDFSVAGLRQGLEGARGNLMLTYLHIVDTVKPQWLVFENVPGILSDHTHAFEHLLDTLQDMGYLLDADILDAQFFDAPQRRERVFVVGRRVDGLLARGGATARTVAAQTIMEICRRVLDAQYAADGADPDPEETGTMRAKALRRRISLFHVDGAGRVKELMALAGATDFPRDGDIRIMLDAARRMGEGDGTHGVRHPSDAIAATMRTALALMPTILAIISQTTGPTPARTPFELEDTTLTLLERFTTYARQKSQQPTLFDGDGDVLPDLLRQAMAHQEAVDRAAARRRSAGKVLPEFEGMSWNTLPGRAKRQALAGRAEEGAGPADRNAGPDGGGCLTPGENQSQRVYDEDGFAPTLAARPDGSHNQQAVWQRTETIPTGVMPFGWQNSPTQGDETETDMTTPLRASSTPAVAFAQNQRGELRRLDDVAGTLAAHEGVKQRTHIIQQARPLRFHNGLPEPQHDDVSPTLLARAGTGGNQTPIVATSPEAFNWFAGSKEQSIGMGDTSPTLRATGKPPAVMCRAGGQANASTGTDYAPTLTSQSKKDPPIVYPAQPGLFDTDADVMGEA